MTDLIARLEAAEVGSRELDGEVWFALRPTADPDVHLQSYETDPEGYWFWIAPTPATTSLDAALALAERVLPGQEYEITTLYGVARVALNLNHGDDGGPYYGSSDCGNVPLALCIAILRAKEASA